MSDYTEWDKWTENNDGVLDHYVGHLDFKINHRISNTSKGVKLVAAIPNVDVTAIHLARETLSLDYVEDFYIRVPTKWISSDLSESEGILLRDLEELDPIVILWQGTRKNLKGNEFEHRVWEIHSYEEFDRILSSLRI